MDPYERSQIADYKNQTLASLGAAAKKGFEECTHVVVMCQTLHAGNVAAEMQDYQTEYGRARVELQQLMTALKDADAKQDYRAARGLTERACITVASAMYIVHKLRDTYRKVKPFYDEEIKKQNVSAAWVAQVPTACDALVRHVALAFVATQQQQDGALDKPQFAAAVRALYQSADHQASLQEAYGAITADAMLTELDHCYHKQQEAQRQAEADAVVAAEAQRQAEADAVVAAEAQRQAEADAVAAAEAQQLADAEAEAQRLADAEAEAQRLAEEEAAAAEAEVQRVADEEAATQRLVQAKAAADAEAAARAQVEVEAAAEAERVAKVKAEAVAAAAQQRRMIDLLKAQAKAELQRAEELEAQAQREADEAAMRAELAATEAAEAIAEAGLSSEEEEEVAL
jgi:hypothetical protein